MQGHECFSSVFLQRLWISTPLGGEDMPEALF